MKITTRCIVPLLALVVLAAGPVFAQTTLELQSDSDVDAALDTDPAAPAPTGDGSSGDPFEHNFGSDSLDMDAFWIRSTNASQSARFILDSLSYDGADGGVFDFRLGASGHTGNLDIQASDSVSVRAITTTSSGGNQEGFAGHVSVTAENDINVSRAPLQGGDNIAVSAQAAGTRNRGGNITMTSASGAISASGLITARGVGGPGGTVTISAANGISITNPEGGISVRSDGDGGNQNNHSGSINLQSSGGAISVAGDLVSRQLNSANAGSVDVEGVSLSLAGIDTRATGTGRSPGNISATATGGNIAISGAIDASGPVPGEGRGNLTLTAENGSITLAELDVSKVEEITFIASVSLGTTIEGQLLGLEDYLDNGTVTRFSENVVGNIFYNASVAGNEYLGGEVYEISGTSFFLIPEPGTLGLLIMGALGLAAFRRRNRN